MYDRIKVRRHSSLGGRSRGPRDDDCKLRDFGCLCFVGKGCCRDNPQTLAAEWGFELRTPVVVAISYLGERPNVQEGIEKPKEAKNDNKTDKKREQDKEISQKSQPDQPDSVKERNKESQRVKLQVKGPKLSSVQRLKSLYSTIIQEFALSSASSLALMSSSFIFPFELLLHIPGKIFDFLLSSAVLGLLSLLHSSIRLSCLGFNFDSGLPGSDSWGSHIALPLSFVTLG
ncbi:hypothetical protein Tco_1569725 [Tanacetum coccineum]